MTRRQKTLKELQAGCFTSELVAFYVYNAIADRRHFTTKLDQIRIERFAERLVQENPAWLAAIVTRYRTGEAGGADDFTDELIEPLLTCARQEFPELTDDPLCLYPTSWRAS